MADPSPAGLEAGAGSMFSLQLYVPGDNPGAATAGCPGSAAHHVESSSSHRLADCRDPKTRESWVHDDDLELNDHTAEVTP